MLGTWSADFGGAKFSSGSGRTFVREAPSEWRVDNGALLMKTALGSIWGDFGKSRPAKNVLVFTEGDSVCPYLNWRDGVVGEAGTTAFGTAGVCGAVPSAQPYSGYVSFGAPSLPWRAEASVSCAITDYGEQAGLLLYADDDSWIKLVLEGNKEGKVVVLLAASQAGQPAVAAKAVVGVAGTETALRIALVVAADGTVAAEWKQGQSAAAAGSEAVAGGSIATGATAGDSWTSLGSLPKPFPVAQAGRPLRTGLMSHGSVTHEADRYARFARVTAGFADVSPLSAQQEQKQRPGQEHAQFNTLWPALRFRRARPSDVDKVIAIEEASYPEDEAAARTSIAMRQREAEDYFLVIEGDVAALLANANAGARASAEAAEGKVISAAAAAGAGAAAGGVGSDGWAVIGYVCSTACASDILEHDTMTSHDPSGATVCIHSVCVAAEYRRLGIASHALYHYCQRLRAAKHASNAVTQASLAAAGLPAAAAPLAPVAPFPVKRVLLISKEHNVGLYTKAGFALDGPSNVAHGKDKWFQCSACI